MPRFLFSYLFTAICLVLAFFYAVESGKSVAGIMTLVVILGILEISLSFDNAVVNATVLEEMDERWRRYFLTWGILIAVFGMRLVFPILLVALVAHLPPVSVVHLALTEPDQYAAYIATSRVEVSAFGGMFLLLVFLTYFLDSEKTFHWLSYIEKQLASWGKLESVEIIIALITLLTLQTFLPEEVRAGAMAYGIGGVVLYVLVDSLSTFFGETTVNGVKRGGAMGFMYLEILDATFSFDGVLGAFAITTDVVIIMLGLAIGAMFVRSLTVFLVEQGTLEEYAYLEHGAHYALGALSILMLTAMLTEVHEVITGLTGVVFIGLSFYSSLRYRRLQKSKAAP